MANFCTKCGQPLPENGICPYCADTAAETTADTDQGQYQQQDPYQGQYQQGPYQQGPYQDPPQDQYQQQGPYQGQYQQNQYQQQGPYQGQYQQNQYQQGSYQQQGPYQGQYQQGPYGGGMSREAEWFNAKKERFVSSTKNMFSEILPVLKAPVTRVQSIASTENPAVGLEFIIAKTIVVLLIILVAIAKIRSEAAKLSGGFGLTDYISIPYFRIIFTAILLTAGVDCMEALLLKVFTKVFNGTASFAGMITVVGARAMYQGLFFLVCGLLIFLSPGTASILFLIGMIISPYIEYGGYIAVADVNPDRKPYVFLIINICMILLMFVFIYIFASDLMSSLGSIFDMLDSF